MSNKTSYLITIQAILFILFLISCFFFNRFAVDDYYFIGKINEQSFKEIYQHLYFNWHGRWTSNFLLLFFIQFYKLPFFLLLFNLLSTCLLYLGIFNLAKTIQYKLNLKQSKTQLIIYSTVFLSILFFCTVNPNETWFWFTGSVVYLWSIIAAIFAIQLYLKQELKWFHYLIFNVSLIYIGGANEPLVMLFIIGFSFSIIKKYNSKLALLGISCILLSFLVNYLSSGTIHRDEITPSLNLLDLFLYSGYGTIKFLFLDFYSTFLIALILSIPFYMLGRQFKGKFSWFKPIKHLIISIVVIGIFAFCNNLIGIYALGGLLPDRALISTSLVIAFIITVYLFLLGGAEYNKNTVFYAPILGCVVLITLSIYCFEVHSTYAKAVDERIEFINSSGKETIVVNELPPSGYIYSTEITTDSNNFKNQHLKSGLGIKNNVILKQK